MATHRFVIEGKEYEVNVGIRSGDRVEVTVNGRAYRVELPNAPVATATPAAPPRPSLAAASPAPAAIPAAGGGGDVRAPISGVVLSIDAAAGKEVKAGARLLVLEAMKMENEIFAPCDGVVQNIAVKPQDQVSTGDLLVSITPA